jgi:hypothetical protein
LFNWGLKNFLTNSYLESQVGKVSRVLLESKPVSYSWFLGQVGQLHILPAKGLITDPLEIAGLECICFSVICGGLFSDFFDDGTGGLEGKT